MFIHALHANAQLQAEAAPASKAVALDLRGDELSPDLKAEVLASMAKRGLKAAPADAPDSPVLRVFTSLQERGENIFLVHVDYLYGRREDIEPKHDAEGRPAGPWPSVALRTAVRDRQRAMERMKEGVIDASVRATTAEPVAPTKAKTVMVPTGEVAGVPPGGSLGGIVGGTGRVVAVDFQQVRVKLQPPSPPYPPMAKIAHIQGTVVVDVTIDPEGIPIEARLVSGPPLLADHATGYAMRWLFEPMTLNGQGMYSRFRLRFNFKLD